MANTKNPPADARFAIGDRANLLHVACREHGYFNRFLLHRWCQRYKTHAVQREFSVVRHRGFFTDYGKRLRPRRVPSLVEYMREKAAQKGEQQSTRHCA